MTVLYNWSSYRQPATPKWPWYEIPCQLKKNTTTAVKREYKGFDNGYTCKPAHLVHIRLWVKCLQHVRLMYLDTQNKVFHFFCRINTVRIWALKSEWKLQFWRINKMHPYQHPKRKRKREGGEEGARNRFDWVSDDARVIEHHLGFQDLS